MILFRGYYYKLYNSYNKILVSTLKKVKKSPQFFERYNPSSTTVNVEISNPNANIYADTEKDNASDKNKHYGKRHG